MKLKNLNIINFRCFRQLKIDFADNVTVLIGKNGAGKSTLIDAIHKALSFVFISDKNYDGFLLADGIKSLKPENFHEEQDFLLDVETGRSVKEISIGAEAEIENQPLSWAMQASTQTYSLSRSAFAPAAYQFLRIVNKRNCYPVLAFYSDTYPYRSKKTVSELITTSPSFGYYCWNSYQGMTGYFIELLAQNLSVISYHRDNIAQLDASIGKAEASGSDTLEYSGSTISKKQAQIEIEQDRKALDTCLKENEYIEKALRLFTENDDILPFKRFRPGRQSGKIEIEDKNGKNWSVEYLPAGYKRILYIVIDIAYRSYLLNKGKEPDGVVIIDEIDLHLHPSLESTVVNRLHRTFPKIQFIMTTHSALVISNLDTSNKDGVRNNVVYKIAQGWLSPQALPNLNGIDATATIRDFMDSPARNVRYEELMSRYIDLFSRDKLEDAENVYSILVREFGDTENLHRDIEERKEEL